MAGHGAGHRSRGTAASDGRDKPGHDDDHATQLPTFSVAARPRRHASTDSGVSFPVRGLSSLGTFSIVMVKRAAAASTRIVCVLRVTFGSAQISTRVRTGPMPASASAAATLTLAG